MEEPRPGAREEHSSEYGPEGPRLDRDARVGRDRLRRGLGLLCRDAALLDRERRDVAGRVYVRQAGDAPVQVDGDESFERLRDAADPRAFQSRQRDDAICG